MRFIIACLVGFGAAVWLSAGIPGSIAGIMGGLLTLIIWKSKKTK